MGLRWPVAAVVWAALACRSAATGGPTGQCEFSLVPGYIVGPSSYKNVPGCASAAACCDLCAADSPCRAFTYELSRHECFLKNGTEGRHSGSKGTVSGAPAPPPLVTPVITLQHGPISRIDPHYKSWNIDASSNRQWDTRNLSAPLLHYLAGASEPGLLRFGGSGNDGLRYGVGRPCPVGAASGAGSGRCLNESHFSRLMEFAEAAGSRIVFGINIRTHDSQGRWDPTEFSSLLQWAIAKGWGSVFWGFELGNGKLKNCAWWAGFFWTIEFCKWLRFVCVVSVDQSCVCLAHLICYAYMIFIQHIITEENGYKPHDAAQDFAILHKVIVKHYPQNKNNTRPKIIGERERIHEDASTKPLT